MNGGNAVAASDTDIAIVGMAGRFPGARNIEEYWANLRDGVESRTEFTDEELEAAGVDAATRRDPNYIRSGFVLEEMECFDAGFFGFSPREAAIMDPQHRHFLECAWEALEHAGHTVGRFAGSIGVFAGCGANTHLMFNLLPNRKLVRSEGFFLLRHTGNDKDFLSTRVSYEMNLTGPSVNVQTACSTSLVATHVACQSLLNGECDMALAGGATIKQPHRMGYLYKEGEVTSPDGHCRAFDARAEGTVFGSAVGVVVLRRLADALADGDTVHAVIRGSAINNDGSAKVGYLAPSVDGQAQAVAEALAIAGVDPATITYVEAHGTGTPVGDPIEIAALTQAFRQGTERKGFCGVGSVKTNIGHVDTAAGVASVIKVTQSLKHRQLPPSLYFEAPNPAIDFENSPFYVNARLREWPGEGAPRRAGVNSLGVGGTNAHVVLEEAPPAPDGDPSRPWQLLLLSARTQGALERASANLARYLRARPEASLPDVAYTLQVGRERFQHRRLLVCRGAEDAADVLESLDARRLLTQSGGERARSVAFMFAGGGAQYPRMGAELYRTEPVFRREVDRCLDLLGPQVDFDLKSLLFAPEERVEEAALQLERPSIALPALFTTQYALARLLISWGIAPDALIGHSMGEYTAAHLAGVFSLEDALSLVTLRGRLFERVPAGGMLSVALPVEELRPMLGDALSVAAVNAPGLCVASGPIEAVEALQRRLEAMEVDCQRVRISIAAHSAMLEPILAEFGDFFRRIALNAPALPFVSNVTGTWITAAEATDPDYWVRHLRQTVRFAEGVETLVASADRVLLEVGPGRTLATLARLHPDGAGKPVVVSMRHPDDASSDVAFVLGAVGQLWLHGVEVDWGAFYAGERRRRLPLPTYPWERQRHWIEPVRRDDAAEPDDDEVERKRPDLATWFYQPSWKRSLAPAAGAGAEPDRTLVFRDAGGLGARLAERLARQGREVVHVVAGAAFARPAADTFEIDPGSAEDYEALVRALAAEGRVPRQIVHCWTATGPGLPSEALETRAFYSLLYLAQAIGREDIDSPIRLEVVSDGMQHVAGEASLSPMKALLVGPCKVIAQEFPNLRCRSIDVALPPAGARQEERLLRQLEAELAADAPDPIVAYRGADRWVQSFEPLPLEEGLPAGTRIREGGVYLITGGLGGIGLELADHLARSARARLVLVGRTALPPRERWQEWLDRHGGEDRTGRRIQRLLDLERSGAEVLVLGADVADAGQMAAAVAEARARFGAIHGVIHAAGVLEDALVLAKTAESAARVLAPKVRGTLVLDEVLRGEPLDFMVLLSSRSAISGIAGQVDYTAANAFLDAFAHRKAELDGVPAVAIDWSAWQEVGMAAELASGARAADGADGAPLRPHPLLDRRLPSRGGEEVYATDFELGGRWVLDEHRIRGGEALIPGTGYLELARAAFEQRPGAGAVELQDVFFMAPFVVRPGERRELRVRLRRSGAGAEFSILARVGEDRWQEQVQGTAAYRDAGSPRAHRVAELLARCNVRSQTFTVRERAHLDLGPRWEGLRRIDYGVDEAVATLELAEEFAGDLEAYRLHPALLDIATGCAQELIHGYDAGADFYVPASYTRLLARGPIPRRCYSHIRYRPSADGDREIVVFDVTILDESGAEVVEISEFVMARVQDREAMSGGATAAGAPWPEPAGGEPEEAGGRLAIDLAEAILPAEGVEAFRRIMAASPVPQVVVSPQDLHRWLARLRTPPARPAAAAAAPEAPAIDVSETEAALASHEAVRQAVVVAKQDRPGSIRIMAYVVYDPDQHTTISELRRYLRARVSEERVPQNFLELDALPLAPDGSVDRRALPDPFGITDDHVAPRTEMERVIAEIWRDLLGLERVGVHDNFLDNGGHSLLAMRALNRIAKKTGVRLSPSALNLQTLEQIAAECEQRARAEAAQTAAPADPQPNQQQSLSQKIFGRIKRTVAPS